MSGLARTAVLIGVLTGMLLVVGGIVGYATGVNIGVALGIALVMAVALNVSMYWFADKWVLKMYKAKIVTEQEEPELHAVVSRLAKNAGLPKPQVAIIPMDNPNAFATGRSPSHSVVAVTKGAKELLSNDELEAVLGHEMAHVKNRDMLTNTMAAIIGAVITYVLYFSLLSGTARRNNSGLLVIGALLVIPFAAMLVRLSISRGREYAADSDGSQISGKPLQLANSLRKLQEWAKTRPMRKGQGNPSTSHLFIVNPFSGTKVTSLFSTHPPMEERIARLTELAKTMGMYP